MMRSIAGQPGHQFWPDELDPAGAPVFESLALVGHRQVTDAYLLGLAQHHHGKLATLDGGVAQLLRTPADRDRYITVVDPE